MINIDIIKNDLLPNVEKLIVLFSEDGKAPNNEYTDQYAKYYKLFEREIEQRKEIHMESKINVLIYGTNFLGHYINDVLELNKVHISGYITEKNKESSEKFLGYNLFSVDEISTMKYDYLILCEELSNENANKIDNNKILDYVSYLLYHWRSGPEFIYNMVQFNSKRNYECITTGISYIQRGINFDKLNCNTACLANPSQDLFYDFEMFKWALNNQRCLNIKYCIMGLNLYSFRYDLSKGKVHGIRTIYYYPITKTMHNFNESIQYIEKYKEYERNLEPLMKDNAIEIMFKYLEGMYGSYEQKNTDIFNEEALSEEEYKEIQEEIQQLFDKPYEETLKENLHIFENYLKLLEEKKIKSLIVIPPFPKIYKENMSQEMRMETESIIEEFQRKYDFEYLNLIDCEKFDDKHFADWSHLNIFGADILTDIINEKLLLFSN